MTEQFSIRTQTMNGEEYIHAGDLQAALKRRQEAWETKATAAAGSDGGLTWAAGETVKSIRMWLFEFLAQSMKG